MSGKKRTMTTRRIREYVREETDDDDETDYGSKEGPMVFTKGPSAALSVRSCVIRH